MTRSFTGQVACVQPASTPSNVVTNDNIIVAPASLMSAAGATTGVVTGAKGVSVVSLTYWANGVYGWTGTTPATTTDMWNFNLGLYQDTLNSAGVMDGNADIILNVSDLLTSTHVYSMPKRVLDRQFFMYKPNSQFNAPANTTGNVLGVINPLMCLERRLRRRIFVRPNEAIAARLEVLFPTTPAGSAVNVVVNFQCIVTYAIRW